MTKYENQLVLNFWRFHFYDVYDFIDYFDCFMTFLCFIFCFSTNQNIDNIHKIFFSKNIFFIKAY